MTAYRWIMQANKKKKKGRDETETESSLVNQIIILTSRARNAPVHFLYNPDIRILGIG